MKKVLQLVFGDAGNVASVVTAVVLAWATARWTPALSGWVLTAALVGAAFWQAG